MLSSPLLYLLSLSVIVVFFVFLEKQFPKLFNYLPSIVLVYLLSMFLASQHFWQVNPQIEHIYKVSKSNLLPAMLFLILLQVNVLSFVKLGKKMLVAYFTALFSLFIAFIALFLLFDFSKSDVGIFASLAGSWMGGTANMLAIASAFNVDETSLAYAVVTDSINYTFWIVLLFMLKPFASLFNHFTKASSSEATLLELGCACSIGAKRYYPLILLAILVSIFSQIFANFFSLISLTTTVVLIATLLGVLGSFTNLKYLNGSSEIATTMLFFLVALIGSQTHLQDVSELFSYVIAGSSILLIHALLMLFFAKLFKLDLFSISIASLANIGGVTSAPILAASYNKNLVGIAIIMAIIGYLVGTVAGLLLGNILGFFIR